MNLEMRLLKYSRNQKRVLDYSIRDRITSYKGLSRKIWDINLKYGLYLPPLNNPIYIHTHTHIHTHGNWIKEFLTNRKFRVVANGCMSEEGDVMSGVPQGTVLAAILFVIIISDIDEKVKNCILRSFADDTRGNKKLICNDKERIQEDLETI